MKFTKPISLVVFAALALGFVQNVHAQTDTWDGGGSNDDFSTGNNWVDNTQPGVGTGWILAFAGSTRLSPWNNYGSWDDFGQILFNSGAGAFNIRGNAIDLGTKIENNSSNLQTLTVAGIGALGSIEINPVSGSLLIAVNNIFMNGNSRQLNVWGNSGHTVTFSNTVIQGTGNTFAINQNSVARFMSAMTYTGDTFISAGTLRFSTGGSANSSTIRLGNTSGTDNAALLVDGGVTLSTGDIVVRSGSSVTKTITTDAASGATATISRNIYLDADVTVSSTTSGGTLTLSGGTFDVKGQLLSVDGAGNVTISSSLSQSTGTGRLTKSGAGTLTLSGNNAYTGATTVTAGMLTLGAADRISDSSALSVSNGATFNMNNFNETVGSIAGAGTITLGSGQLIAGGDNSSTFYSGAMGGTGAFVKTGTGTLTLSGANNYSGQSYLVGGTTLFTATQGASLTNTINVGETSGSATATFALSNGITMNNPIIVRSGSSGTKMIQSLNTSGTNTLSGTIALSNNVTFDSASGGTLAVTGVMSNTGQVTKTGSGTLVLGGNNTFSGGIVISAGTLSITNANSLGTGQFNFGNASTLTTLLVNSNTTITNTFQVYNAAANAVIDVASGTTTTISGKFTQDGGKTNSTKFGKAGAGTLIFSNATSDFNGQMQIGQGTAILATANALGTNTSTGARGIDLGFNVGDVNQTNNVSVLAINGVTVGQSFYVTPNTNNATRTIGLSGNGTNTFSNEFYLDGNLTVSVAAATDQVNISGAIINSGGLIKTGSGTLVLSGANTYSGGTTINSGGILSVGAGGTSGALGTGNVTNNGTLNFNRTDAFTVTNLISGSGQVTVTNSVTLSGANTYTGLTTIRAGATIRLGNASGLGSTNGTTTILGALDLNGLSVAEGITGSGTGVSSSGFIYNSSASAATLSGNLALGGGNNHIYVTNGAITLSGVVSDSGGVRVLTKQGSGTLYLYGANTYSGGLTLAAGTVAITNIAAVGSGTLNFDNGTLDVTNNNLTFSNAVSISGSSAITGSGSATFTNAASIGSTSSYILTNNLTGGLTLSNLTLGNVGQTTNRTLTLAGTGNTTINGVISSATSTNNPAWTSGLIINAAGTTVTLNGSNTFTGPLTLTAGTLAIGNNGALSTGSVDFAAGAGIRTADATARTVTNAISLRDLLVTGTGALTLSGTITNVGTAFNITNNSSALLTLGDVKLSSSTTTRTLTLAGSGNTTISGVIANGDLASNGNVTINATGTTVTFGGNNTYGGATAISNGVLNIRHANALGGTGTGTTVSSGAALEIQGGITTAAEALSLNGTGVSTGGALRNISGVNVYAGAITLAGATRINSDAGTLTLSGAIGGNTQNLTVGGAGNTTISGAIGTTTGTLTKADAGTLILSGANTYTGGTTISNGILQIGAGGSTGSLVGNITNSGTVTFNRSDDLTYGSVISGSGALTKLGAGKLTLTGANTLTGGTTVSAGTLQIGAGGGTGQLGSGDITNNATLAFNRTGSLMVSNAISGTGNVSLTNSGTITFAGANSYTGNTAIDGATLQVSVANNLGASTNAVTIDNSGTLRATASLTNSRNITITTGKTGYVEAAAGTTNTLSGTLSKNGSVLVLGGGGTHIVNGSITGASANSDLVVSNSTTTINSTNSYNGPTFIVAAGTLNNGTNNALPTDTALTLGQSGETSSTTNRYNLNGYSQTVASVATAGSSVNIVTNSTGTGNLTLNSSSAKSISNLTMGGTGLTLTKSGANTVTLASGNNIGPGTIAIQQGTLLLGAANQIGDSTAINLSGGILSTAGYADAAGKLTVSANSTIQGLNSTSGAAFTFSDVDLSNYSTSSGSTLTFVNSAGGNYSLGTVFQISTVAANSWTGYSETSLNNFSQKIQFGNGNVGQISFGSGISGTTLTVAAIPDARVYTAAVVLLVLIGLTEYRRRRRLCRR